MHSGSPSHMSRLTRAIPDPLRHQTQITRLTDYPVGSSSASSCTTSIRSETDSLSTVSESSFTSDSSYAYDANKKPKKKILKNSNAPRRPHKHRVRWNFENLESVSDADTISLDSTSSVSSYTPNKAYKQSRTNMTRTLQNWQEFERPLPQGSTGLTPNHIRGLSHSHQALYSTTSLDSSASQTPSPRYPNGFHGRQIYRTYSDDIHSPSKGMTANQHQNLRHVVSVDPNHFRRHHSQPINSTPLPSQQGPHTRVYPPQYNTQVRVPILYLDEESIPDLERSTMEERAQCHLYKFPQNETHNSRALHTVLEDDQCDYDHLSPEETEKQPLNALDRLAPSKPDDRWYSNEDIEEALKQLELEGEDVDGESSSDMEEKPKTTETPPPPVPPKQRKKLSPPTPPKRVSSLTNVHSTVPLPSPPLTTTSQEQLEDEVRVHSESIILPPPPEFADDTPSQNSPDFSSKTDPISENIFHSPSCETLKSYDVPSSPEGGLTPMESEIYPETKPEIDPGLSWGPLNDRIVEGAEDPHRHPSPPHVAPMVSQGFQVPKSSSTLSNGLGHLISNTEWNLKQKMASTGDIPRSSSLSSPPHTSNTTRHNSLSPKISRENLDQKHIRGPTALPHNANVGLTREEQAIMQRYKQPQTMKPIIVDTDKEIEQMILELETGIQQKQQNDTSQLNQTSSLPVQHQKYFGKLICTINCFILFGVFTKGTCCVCRKAIETSLSLFSFASRLYHTRCFCCAQCGKLYAYK